MRTTIRNLAVAAMPGSSLSLAPAGASACMGDDGPSMAGSHFKRMTTEPGLSAQQVQKPGELRATMDQRGDRTLSRAPMGIEGDK